MIYRSHLVGSAAALFWSCCVRDMKRGTAAKSGVKMEVKAERVAKIAKTEPKMEKKKEEEEEEAESSAKTEPLQMVPILKEEEEKEEEEEVRQRFLSTKMEMAQPVGGEDDETMELLEQNVCWPKARPKQRSWAPAGSTESPTGAPPKAVEQVIKCKIIQYIFLNRICESKKKRCSDITKTRCSDRNNAAATEIE